MTAVQTQELAQFLARHPPFDALDEETLAAVAEAAQVDTFARGEQVLDAFKEPTVEVFVVLAGRVNLWNNADRVGAAPDEVVGPGFVFGFSAMLTERSVGPRAVAVTAVRVARLPASAVGPAFASRRGARFLAERLSTAPELVAESATYTVVDDLIVRTPLLVERDVPVGEVARLMTERDVPCAAVRLGRGRYGLVTDALLRRRVIVEGQDLSTPIGGLVTPAPTVLAGDSAAEALLTMLDVDAEFLLVTSRSGALRGVIAPRDFAVSPSTAGVALNEQLRRASSVEEVDRLARQVPSTLADLLSRGLASRRVIAVHSALLDTIVRRAIALIFERHTELSVDAFTWLALGSNGRREAVLSSDVDSAVTFVADLAPQEADRYRAAFAEVTGVLAGAGLTGDDHGATASRPLFSRSDEEWRAAGRDWLADPTEHNGAMMTSLMVDGRPIHGDPGLPAVARVFGDLRRHPGTMRLLLQESLSSRARLRSMRQVLTRGGDSFDLKAHALVPIVNIGRWAALSVGSTALPTTERLRDGAGSAMLPQGQADTLLEVFDTLQRLRLRYQLLQVQAGDPATDVFDMERLSPLDRTVVSQAVREVSAIQRRMANVSAYTPPAAWTVPAPT